MNHPGYHKVKPADPHDQQVVLQGDGGALDVPEDKGPVVMQQGPPNLNAKVSLCMSLIPASSSSL